MGSEVNVVKCVQLFSLDIYTLTNNGHGPLSILGFENTICIACMKVSSVACHRSVGSSG